MKVFFCGRAQANLRQAFAIEEGLGYMEPPRQYQPTKHCLGYVLMRAGKNQTAAEVSHSVAFPNSDSTVHTCAFSLRRCVSLMMHACEVIAECCPAAVEAFKDIFF